MGTEQQLDEAARAQSGYLILKKHLGRVGAEITGDRLPTSWFDFSSLLYVNIIELVRQGGHSAMLRELLAELVRFTQAFSGKYFTDNLYELLKPVIEQPKLCEVIEPLLPPETPRMEELKEMLWKEWDDDRRRADEGYY